MLNHTVFKINKYQNVKRAYTNKKTKKNIKETAYEKNFLKINNILQKYRR